MKDVQERRERALREALNLEISLQELGVAISNVRYEASNVYIIFEQEDWELCLYGFRRKQDYEYVLKYAKKGYIGKWVEIGFGDEDLEKYLMNYEGLNGPATKIYCSPFDSIGPTNYDNDEQIVGREKAIKFVKSWLKTF